jgi:MFS family permease
MQHVTKEDAQPHGRVYPWVVVGFLMILYTSSYIDRTILSLLVKPIRADLQISDTQFSLLAGFAFVIMYSIAGIPSGWIVDRWSRRGIISIGVAFWSIMTAACGLAGSFGALFAARVGVGIGEATLSPAAYSITSDYFKANRLSRALSIYALGIPIGTGLALMIGGTVVQVASEAGPMDLPLVGLTKPWQLVFFTVGLPGLLLAALTLLLIREPPRGETLKDVQTHERIRIGATLAYMWQHKAIYSSAFFGVGFCALFAYGTNAWYPTFLHRVHGISIPEAGLFLGISSVVFGVAGAIFAGWWADWLAARGRKDAQLLVNFWYGVGLFTFGALGPLMPNAGLAMGMMAAAAFFTKTAIGVMAAMVQIVTPNRMRGQVSAVYLFMVALIGQGLGPTTVALSTDYIFNDDNAVGYSLALVGTVFIALGCFAFLQGRKSVMARLEQM